MQSHQVRSRHALWIKSSRLAPRKSAQRSSQKTKSGPKKARLRWNLARAFASISHRKKVTASPANFSARNGIPGARYTSTVTNWRNPTFIVCGALCRKIEGKNGHEHAACRHHRLRPGGRKAHEVASAGERHGRVRSEPGARAETCSARTQLRSHGFSREGCRVGESGLRDDRDGECFACADCSESPACGQARARRKAGSYQRP